MEYKIIKITDMPSLKEKAAEWFSEKWKNPITAYLESMEESIFNKKSVPQWYIALENERIIAGLGIIENDFHNRKDLAPNICAVYTEQDKRRNGIAGALLNYACEDMKSIGVDTLYLITNHTSFYEHYGWKYLCMVQGDGEPNMTRMYVHKQKHS